MANKKYEETDIQAIADIIREKTGSEDSYKVSDMASGVDEVYEAGKKAEYDEFMDMYIKARNTSESSAYAFFQWEETFFYPTKDIVGRTTCNKMFYNMTAKINRTFNLKERFEECGVILDMSQATNVERTFGWSPFTELPTLDFSRLVAKAGEYTFNSSKALETIEKIIVTETPTFNGWFNECISLKNITFEGVIGKSISFSYSPLSVESMKSIITHLKDYSTDTANHYTYTVTFKASAFEALEAEGETAEYNGVACTWAELIDNLKWNLVKA